LGIRVLAQRRSNHGMISESMTPILDGLQERIGRFAGGRGYCIPGIRTLRRVGGFISRSGIKQELHFIVKGKL
jgi:hypothetical protein